MFSNKKNDKVIARNPLETRQQGSMPMKQSYKLRNQRQVSIELRKLAALPLISALKDAGFNIHSLDELRRSGLKYGAAIPILLKWLPLTDDAIIKESIVRTLSVPWARPAALCPLIAEFRNASAMPNLQWVIGNAMAVISDDSVFNEISELVREKQYGKSREMLTVALANMKNPAAIDLLIELLNDDEINGHALMALGKLKAQKARPKIERFLDHPKSWVRKEAGKALKALTKNQ
jgi:hypothetical protein